MSYNEPGYYRFSENTGLSFDLKFYFAQVQRSRFQPFR